MRSDLEKFLYEELGLKEVSESHSILSKIIAFKLLKKCDAQTEISSITLASLTKAILNEQKLVYKYRDIE